MIETKGDRDREEEYIPEIAAEEANKLNSFRKHVYRCHHHPTPETRRLGPRLGGFVVCEEKKTDP